MDVNTLISYSASSSPGCSSPRVGLLFVISASIVEMDSEEEAISMDIVEDEEEEEEEIGIEDGGESFPTTDRVFKEAEVVDEDDFHFEVITADDIVQHMVDCIKDVNSVVQVQHAD